MHNLLRGARRLIASHVEEQLEALLRAVIVVVCGRNSKSNLYGHKTARVAAETNKV